MFLYLPLHPLFVHLPVVLIPLATLAVIALVVLKRPSKQLSLAVLGVVVVAAVSSIASFLSGKALAELKGYEPETHERWGLFLMISAIAFLLVAAPWLWKVSRAGDDTPTGRPLGMAAAVVGVVASIFTFLAGHSGAELAWSDAASGKSETTTSPTAPAQSSSAPQASTSAAMSSHTTEEVAKHNTAEDCWAIVDGKVYDLTDWVNQHPGGAGAISKMCGTDATEAFQKKHGGDDNPAKALERHQIGTLAAGGGSESAAPSSSQGGYTAEEVAKHNTPEDCWAIVDGKAYDLTSWVNQHPGGAGAISKMCGTDATEAFQKKHGGDDNPAKALERHLLGPVS